MTIKSMPTTEKYRKGWDDVYGKDDVKICKCKNRDDGEEITIEGKSFFICRGCEKYWEHK